METDKFSALVVVLGCEFSAHRGVERCPRRHDLAHRDAVRDAALTIEKDPFRRLDADRSVIADAAPMEGFDHVGLQNDPAAPAVEIVRRTLVDIDVPADRAEKEACKQAS